jgi:hypothetical protein
MKRTMPPRKGAYGLSIEETDPLRKSEPAAPDLAQIEERIRVRLRRTAEDIIEIGRDLLEAKRILPHGEFLPWLGRAFDMSERSAVRFMQCADRFASKSASVADLSPQVLYLLAQPSTPSEAVTAVTEAAKDKPVTHAEAKTIIADAKGRQQPARKASAAQAKPKRRSSDEVQRENERRNFQCATLVVERVCSDLEKIPIPPALPRDEAMRALDEIEAGLAALERYKDRLVAECGLGLEI